MLDNNLSAWLFHSINISLTPSLYRSGNDNDSIRAAQHTLWKNIFLEKQQGSKPLCQVCNTSSLHYVFLYFGRSHTWPPPPLNKRDELFPAVTATSYCLAWHMDIGWRVEKKSLASVHATMQIQTIQKDIGFSLWPIVLLCQHVRTRAHLTRPEWICTWKDIDMRLYNRRYYSTVFTAWLGGGGGW